jgi:methylated-DNA-protein-cysteine methyltransferase related protein
MGTDTTVRVTESREAFSAAVLDVVDRIPPGRVMTYGLIAEYLGRGGPRGVGGVMARDGLAVAWWRVVRANGTLPAHLMIDAQQHWRAEGTPTHRGLVNIARALWQPHC